MNSGRDHGAEKSDNFDGPFNVPSKLFKLLAGEG
jgi:hypothetical protein